MINYFNTEAFFCLSLPTGAMRVDLKHLNPMSTAVAPKNAARENFLKKTESIIMLKPGLPYSILKLVTVG